MRVTTADFLKNFGALSDMALAGPITVTKHGRDRLVVISASDYDRLKRRDRRVVAAEDLSDDELALIAQTEPSPDLADLDRELDDRTT